MCKDESEIRAIRKAVRIGEQAFSELTARGAKYWIGRSEKQLAAELEYLMRLGGADEVSFPTIIAVGSHGSLPHYLPAGRRVRRGDPILIDWGARVAGYCGDLTRVVFAGTIPPKIAHLYEVVWKAQQAGIAAIRPGVRCSSVDAAARAVIEQAGLGEKCLHGLGHGLGREVHESPSLGRVDNRPLRAGMVVTVEPGVYWPGLGGVRIEDDILVTARGARWLSTLPRAIEHMVLRG
jgi:Xaa-Pro aminopeptidase